VALSLRENRYKWEWGRGGASFGRINAQLVAQNLGFLLLGYLPSWSMAIASGTGSLGAYSRAQLIGGMPATAATQAINRALQPNWRHLDGDRQVARAITDAAMATAFFLVPAFVALSSLASPIIALWLGTGWEEAAWLLRLLAVAYCAQALFTVVANAAEMRMQLKSVRIGQYMHAVVLVPALALAVKLSSVTLIVVAFGVSQTFALGVLIWDLGRKGLVESRRLIGALAWETALMVPAGALVAILTSQTAMSVWHSVISIGIGLTGLGAYVAVTVKLKPSWMVVRQRILGEL
jgi:hypothetical protein